MAVMRRNMLLTTMWVLATVATGLVAWSAVQVAGARTNPDPIRPLSAAEVAALPGTIVAPAQPNANSGPRAGEVEVPASVTTGVDGAQDDGTATSSPAAVSTSSATTAAPTTTQASPPVTTQPTTTTTPTTTSTASPTTEVVVYHLEGGSLGVEVTGDNVSHVWSTPNPGFHKEVKNFGPEKVVVEFESDSHESKISITVDNGQLVEERSEEPEGEDD